LKTWDPADFALKGPGDFVRLDGLCAEFLGDFYGWLQSPEGGSLDPADASPLAHAADRYLRDFVVDAKETGPSDADPSLPRQYLANWYIVNTLEPSHAETDRILRALRLLYRCLGAAGLLDEVQARAVAETLEDGEFFHRRLEDFWSLTPHDVPAWRAVAEYRKGRSPPARGDSA